ncbi:MAG: uracil-DNA glycosylase [Candidatus Pacebacteria bacterium]|nr:uracil-DNA glycosylase [Candidatus Paceibacterota bacterium]
MTKQEELIELHTKWANENSCVLKATATQPVFGDGPATASIVFIGEAPGKKEDEEGVPFIGSAGKFLSEMLDGIGMKREDVYITNIVKYRPPDNRDPMPSEKEACAPWLYEELNLIKPKLIVFLGRHSMNNFFPELKISEVHGKLIHKKFKTTPITPETECSSRRERGLRLRCSNPTPQEKTSEQQRNASVSGVIETEYFLPLYHPASALYNGGMRDTLKKDFSLIPKILKKIK